MLDSRQYLSISDILRVSGDYSFDLNWLNGVEKAAETDNLPDRRDAAALFPPPEPTHFLEPAVPFVTALGMKLNPFFDPSWTFEELTEGQGARAVKTANLLWAFLLLFGTGVLAKAVLPRGKTGGGAGATGRAERFLPLAAVTMMFVFLVATDHIDRLLSDIPAMALLVWVTLFSLLSWKKRRNIDFILLGLSWGVLSLTKAVFFYLFPVFLVLCAAFSLFSRKWNAGRRWAFLLLPSLLFAASVTPWMARNYVRIGEFSISERGGETLYFRALKNGMTDEEYRGSFYVWSPIQFRPLVSRLTGYTDRDMQRGGRAAALNRERSNFTDSDYRHISAGDPESAIAYYNKTYALKNRIRRMMGNDMAATGEYLLQGEVNRRVDGRLKEMAVKMILESPVLHLRTTIPFLYRGIWGIAGLGRMGPVLTLRPTTVPENEEVNDTPPALAVLWLFMFLAFLSSLCGLFVYGIWKDGAYAAMLLPSFSLMGCLAFLTHNLPRYNLPVFPVALVSLMVCSLLLFRQLVRIFAGQRSMTD